MSNVTPKFPVPTEEDIDAIIASARRREGKPNINPALKDAFDNGTIEEHLAKRRVHLGAMVMIMKEHENLGEFFRDALVLTSLSMINFGKAENNRVVQMLTQQITPVFSDKGAELASIIGTLQTASQPGGDPIDLLLGIISGPIGPKGPKE